MSKDAPKLRFRAKRQHNRVIWSACRRALSSFGPSETSEIRSFESFGSDPQTTVV